MFPVALAIGAGISALSSIAGGVSANKRRKKADQILEDRRRRLDEWYQSEMNQPYLDRADSRAMLKRIRDYNEDELKALNTNAIKSGATDEAKVAAAGKLNKNYSQVVAQIAGLGEQYQARLDNLDNARYEAESGKISGMQNMVSGVGDAFGQLAMLYGLGGFGKSGLAGITGNN